MTAIKVQDEYVSKVSGYDPRSRNYYTLLTKAAKKARTAFMDYGYSESQARQLVDEAHDVACHERFLRQIKWTTGA